MTYNVKVIDPTTGKVQETTIVAATVEELERAIAKSYNQCFVEVTLFGRK